MQSIQINSSDLAKFVGLNPYVDDEERDLCFWSKNKRLALDLGVPVQRRATQIEQWARAAAPEEIRITRTALSLADTATEPEVVAALRDAVVKPAVACERNRESKEIASTLSGILPRGAVPASLSAALEHETRLERGTRRETSAIDAFEQATQASVHRRNDCAFTNQLFEWEGRRVMLVGRVDGIAKDTGEVVEAKQRRNRLFGRVVDYERAQMHCYMHLTGASSALLIETYDNRSQTHAVQFDDGFWQMCIDKLKLYLSGVVERASTLRAKKESVAAEVDEP
tara:strand:- start:27654 stop:28502 length:849 start_codon:yes stop_codon:yes gene_type:complete